MDLAENSQAIQLLRELDERQDQVLSELDDLNLRVEKVLELYLGSRRPAADSGLATVAENKAA